MNIDFLTVILLAMASFRLTRLMVYDKITEFVRRPFFDELEETNEEGEQVIYLIPKKEGLRHFFGELLSCYWCSGVWASALLVIFYCLFEMVAVPIIVILAVAGIASMVETWIQYAIEKK